MGPNGSGKSTLLGILGGFEPPDSGSVLWHGRSVADLSATERARRRASEFGVVFQSLGLFPALTARENVYLPLLISGTDPHFSAAAAESWLHRLGLLSEQTMENARRRHGSTDYRNAEGIMRQVFVRMVTERYDEELARSTRLRLWSEHLEKDEKAVSGSPADVVDRLWWPIATEQLHRIERGEPLTHRLVRLPGVSRRRRRVFGSLESHLYDM